MVYLAPESDCSISVFGGKVFEERARRLAELSGPAGRLKNYMRLYYSQAEETEVDAQGRIRIPERLIQFAGLKQEVVFLGVHDHVELWDPENWKHFLSSHGSDFDELTDQAFS